MPWGDRTGPWGTFRNCIPTGNQPVTQTRPFYGRGFFRRGGGRGMGWRFYSQPTQSAQPIQPAPQQETMELQNQKQFLEQELSQLKQELETISKKIKELKKE